jgi:hypothetical protein
VKATRNRAEPIKGCVGIHSETRDGHRIVRIRPAELVIEKEGSTVSQILNPLCRARVMVPVRVCEGRGFVSKDVCEGGVRVFYLTSYHPVFATREGGMRPRMVADCDSRGLQRSEIVA